MHDIPTLSRPDIIRHLSDLSTEPFYDFYLDILAKLNKIALSAGEAVEGNIFYEHNSTALEELSPRFLNKRRALAAAAQMFNNTLEIGFNAGHSALLLLIANHKLNYTAIDICTHNYTIPCFEYLRSLFGNRINLVQGNSMHAFPLLNDHEFDFYIIDGGHGVEVAEADLKNVIKFGRHDSIILFDDSDFPQLRTIINMYLISGKIIGISDPFWLLKNTNQMFFINNNKNVK